MARVAMFGLGPMRWEQSTRLFALALRTWHFAKTAADAGHDVLLVSIRGQAYEGWPPDKTTLVERDGVTVWSVSEHLVHERPEWIERKLARFGPDALVGVNRDPAAVAVNFAQGLPLWADINGDPMAEAQAKAAAIGHDRDIPEWHRKFMPVLIRADRFSTCSRAQRTALIGQLGLAGRLTAGNDGCDLVVAVPNSVDEEELRTLGALPRRRRKATDPFLLLWSGGYNTWIDPDTLYEAVDCAMGKASGLKFVSTGGGIPGHHLDAFARFQERISRSTHRSRYELAGWVQTSELPGYYAAADGAILVDRFTYEGTLGARTRMLDWLAARVPIVCTRLSEISEDLAARDIALVADCGDAQGLERAILKLVSNPADAHARAERGRRLAERELRATVSLEPLLSWLSAPKRAPDGEHRAVARSVPAPVYELRKHAHLFREEMKSHGLFGALDKTRGYAARKVRHGVLRALDGFRLEEPPQQLLETNVGAPAEPPRLSVFDWRRRLESRERLPPVAFVLRVLAGDEPDYVDWTIEQVRRQYYPAWRLVVVAPRALPDPLARRLEQCHERFLAGGLSFERAYAEGEPLKHRAIVTARYAMVLGPGDLLRPDALAELVTRAEDDELDFVYADEQEIDETSVPHPPRRKPAFVPELLLAKSTVGRAALVSTPLLDVPTDHLGSWDMDALSYELALRATEKTSAVGHVPEVLCQIYVPGASEAERVLAARAVAEQEEQAVRDSVWRRGWTADVERGAEPRTFRVRFTAARPRRISVVIPDAASPALLERCLAALEERGGPGLEPIVVHRRGSAPKLPRSARSVSVKGQGTGMELASAGVRAAESDLVLVLHPRVEVVTTGWLSALLSELARPGVGAVSPKVLLTDGRLVWPELAPEGDWMRSLPHRVRAPSAWCTLTRKKYVGKLGVGTLEQAAVELSRRLERRRLVPLFTPDAAVYLHPANGAPVASIRERPSRPRDAANPRR